MMKFVKVRNVLVTLDDKILLGLTKKYKWGLPGGKVGEEHVHEASIREQQEETSMILCGMPRLIAYIDNGKFVELVLLWSQWVGTPVVVEENNHLEWKWFPLKELREIKLTKSARFFVDSIMPTVFPSF